MTDAALYFAYDDIWSTRFVGKWTITTVLMDGLPTDYELGWTDDNGERYEPVANFRSIDDAHFTIDFLENLKEVAELSIALEESGFEKQKTEGFSTGDALYEMAGDDHALVIQTSLDEFSLVKISNANPILRTEIARVAWCNGSRPVDCHGQRANTLIALVCAVASRQ